MKNTELLNGFSIEELQERNEFSAAIEDAVCCEYCCKEIIITPSS